MKATEHVLDLHKTIDEAVQTLALVQNTLFLMLESNLDPGESLNTDTIAGLERLSGEARKNLRRIGDALPHLNVRYTANEYGYDVVDGPTIVQSFEQFAEAAAWGRKSTARLDAMRARELVAEAARLQAHKEETPAPA